jgi:hypothetical protein
LTDECKQHIRDDYAKMAEVMIAAFERDEALTPDSVDSEQFLRTVIDTTLGVLRNNTTLMANQMKSEAERLAKEMKK